jgi:hypothetical protein
MFQRIQSLWLIIALSLSLFLTKGPIVSFSCQDKQNYIAGFSGISKLTESGSEIIRSSIVLSALIISLPVISVVALLLFKRLKFQKKITILLILFSAFLTILILYNCSAVMTTYKCQFVPGIKMFLPALIIVSEIFALRGIAKDEALLKSYDRLR